MEAETGAFAISAAAASLIAERIMAAETGAFLVAGNTANIHVGLTLVIDAAGFVVDTFEAVLVPQRRLQADAGVYIISGSDAGLLYSGFRIPVIPLRVVLGDGRSFVQLNSGEAYIDIQ